MQTWWKYIYFLTFLRDVFYINITTTNLANGTRNVTSLGGKDPELVREVEPYRQETVRLASMHSLGSEIQLLERDWALSTRVARNERQQAGVGLLLAPQLVDFNTHVGKDSDTPRSCWGLVHHSGWRYWGTSDVPRWQGIRGGWDPSFLTELPYLVMCMLAAKTVNSKKKKKKAKQSDIPRRFLRWDDEPIVYHILSNLLSFNSVWRVLKITHLFLVQHEM